MTSEETKSERIDVDSDGDIRYWTAELDVSEQSLRDAVARVGPAMRDVRRALDK